MHYYMIFISQDLHSINFLKLIMLFPLFLKSFKNTIQQDLKFIKTYIY